MEISSSQTTTATPFSNTDANGSSTEISSDFETFLKMLTVQMQNQDPLNPVDSSDYAVQLATFSNVEQQVQTNDILRDLKSQFGMTGMAQMADWVGKEARAVAPAELNGAPITVFPKPVNGATEMDIVVRDAQGFEVARMTNPVSNDPIEWSGLKENGLPARPGYYSFDVESYDGDVLLETSQAAVFAVVREVQKTPDGDTMVVFADGTSVPTDDVSAIRAAGG